MTPQWLRNGCPKKFKLLKYEHIIYHIILKHVIWNISFFALTIQAQHRLQRANLLSKSVNTGKSTNVDIVFLHYTFFFIRNSFVRNLYWGGQIAKKLSVVMPPRLRNFCFCFFFIFNIIILKTQ